MAFKTMVSKSRGIAGLSFRGPGGSPCVILAIKLLRLLSSKAGRKVSNS